MRIVIGIPARLGSTRLPGKPLMPILGMSMIEHVFQRCRLAKNIDDIFIACCDQEIEFEATKFGCKAIMTSRDISRPGLRVAKACESLNLNDNDIVVVVQGDEPLIYPEMIDIAVKPLLDDPNVKLLTLIANANEKEWLDENEVKVVIDKNKDILFMSRSPIPSNTRNRVGNRFKQVAIMPFRKKFLIDFQNMNSMPLEISESVELLRALEHGVKVKTADSSKYKTVAVDTKKDLEVVEEIMRNDKYFQLYR